MVAAPCGSSRTSSEQRVSIPAKPTVFCLSLDLLAARGVMGSSKIGLKGSRVYQREVAGRRTALDCRTEVPDSESRPVRTEYESVQLM